MLPRDVDIPPFVLSGKSSYHNTAEKEQNRELEDRRHDANVQSKFLILLENLGIPWHDLRYQKPGHETLSARYKCGPKVLLSH